MDTCMVERLTNSKREREKSGSISCIEIGAGEFLGVKDDTQGKEEQYFHGGCYVKLFLSASGEGAMDSRLNVPVTP